MDKSTSLVWATLLPSRTLLSILKTSLSWQGSQVCCNCRAYYTVIYLTVLVLMTVYEVQREKAIFPCSIQREYDFYGHIFNNIPLANLFTHKESILCWIPD